LIFEKIKNYVSLINYSTNKGFSFFKKERRLKYKTHIYSSLLYKKNSCFFVVLSEKIPYPNSTIYRVIKMPESGEIEVINNFLSLEEAKTLFYKLSYGKHNTSSGDREVSTRSCTMCNHSV
jgi:hypothetical protein